MSALLALALAIAPGCPDALAAAAALPADALAARAPELARTLEAAGLGPTAALARAADALAAVRGGGERDSAAARFRDALTRHCALATLPRGPDATEADHAALARILARPELSAARTDPQALRRTLARLWDWLVELLGTEEAESYASVGRALFVGVAAAAAVLAGAALRRRRQSALGERSAGTGGRRVPETAEDDGSARRAEEALARGEAREAVRLALLAAIGALEQARVIPRGRAMTNAEIVEASTATSTPTAIPTLAGDVDLLARAFDRAVYGNLPVPAAEARDAVERARRIGAAAGGAR